MKVEFLEAAHLEFLDAIEYYNLKDDWLGLKFKSEINKAIRIIVKYPDSYPLYSNRTRKAKINKFPYNLIYSNQPGKILIIAVAHQHRKPNYWERR